MMQDNKFNLGDILTHKKYGGKYKVIFKGDIDEVPDFLVLEIEEYKNGHGVEGFRPMPYFINDLNLYINTNKRYTWGSSSSIGDFFKQASVKYTELAEFMYPDGYRDGDRWVIV
jgi:hypothetical protein